LKWHEKFAEALDIKKAEGYPLLYEVVNLNRHDWIKALEPFDLLIWNPTYMGSCSAGFFKDCTAKTTG
jgi:hypothetical protein